MSLGLNKIIHFFTVLHDFLHRMSPWMRPNQDGDCHGFCTFLWGLPSSRKFPQMSQWGMEPQDLPHQVPWTTCGQVLSPVSVAVCLQIIVFMRVYLSLLLMVAGDLLWETECWTRWAFGPGLKRFFLMFLYYALQGSGAEHACWDQAANCLP